MTKKKTQVKGLASHSKDTPLTNIEPQVHACYNNTPVWWVRASFARKLERMMYKIAKRRSKPSELDDEQPQHNED